MKRLISAAIFAWAGAMCANAMAQGASSPDAMQAAPAAPPAQATQSNDEIVKMHNEIRAANRVYDKRVAAAKKVYDEKVKAAKAERDKAISAARSGTSGT